MNELAEKTTPEKTTLAEKNGFGLPFDMTQLCDVTSSWCLNQDDDTPFTNLWTEDSFLRSDCDEQLLIHIEFKQRLKLRHLSFSTNSALPSAVPSLVKIFIDSPNMDFNSVVDTLPTQVLQLTDVDYRPGSLTDLEFVRFQNIGSITLFVEENNTDEDKTFFPQLQLFGVPLETCNVSNIQKC